MSLAGLLTILDADPQLHDVVARVDHDSAAGDGLTGATLAGEDLVAPPSLRPVLAAALTRRAQRPGGFVLAVTATAREADDLVAGLGSFLPPAAVACFPGWETLPHERLSPRSDTVGQRIAVLRRLAHPADPGEPNGPLTVVVAPVRSLLQPIVAGLGDLEPVSLHIGQGAELDDLLVRLVEIGYTRTDLVTGRSEIAVRGGIVDVFPPTEEHPVRVEFFGDTVEEIRYFKVADQRSIGVAEDGLWAPPCRELLLTPAVRERAKELADTHPDLADILGKLAEGITVEGMEAFAPVLAERMELLLDYVPPGGIVLACDPERVRTRAEELFRTSQEFLEASWFSAAMRGEGEAGGGQAPIDLGAAAFQPIARIRTAAAALGLPWWTIAPFGVTDSGEPGGASAGSGASLPGPEERVPFRINAALAPAYRGDTARMITDVRGWLADGWRVVLVTEGHGPAQRLAEMLRGEDIGARLAEVDDPPEPGVPYVTTARVENGFVWPAVKLALLTESDLAGHPAGLPTTRDMRRMPSRRRGGVDPLQLKAGDYVVHEQHGVGRYVEMTSRTTAGATREYLVIEYAPNKRGQPADRLYVPTDQLDEVTRYSGGEAPTLHRLGGGDWAKAKGRARKAVRQIASELIRLYSARMASPGFAFGPDTPWQRELEDAFPYVETPDQLGAIDEVKHDMERPVPMDRLICGDVGYGKTEIAVRAAFKAVQDGKQVAVLVPTTLLVQQHFSTFSERYAPFPVTVKPLSRFQGSAETAQTLSGLAGGTVDVVIGTHKLLSPETRFARLGLVIIDEEQRFGVEHKEYLKRLRTEVDVLGMSATPIPRTLEMGVAGIREMSTILTPPEERHPVLTFVGPYDERQVAAAIRRELLRDGQVFFVHNRVSSIRKVAAQIAGLVPEARIAVAHGQMNEHELEQIMVDFWEGNYDVLVSTTIVESGLDIPNANTLIIDRADMYGLSQLHQLRGRVGRGSERAYAYFLYPPERALTETAHERLATVAQHTEIGAGMYVAMKDLEIRGAGNLLGGEQSGHIAGVGFDLYVRMIGEAVNELKGDGPAEKPEVRVELPVNAHIPHDYVPGERLRLEAYTQIAAIDAEADVLAIADELSDRYGEPPEPVLNLLEVARLRTAARRAGLTDITAAGNHIRFAPVDLPDSRQVRVQRLYPKTVLKPAVRTMLVPVPKTASIGGQPLRDTELLAWCGEVIRSVLADLAVGALFSDEGEQSGASEAYRGFRRRARRRPGGDRVLIGQDGCRGDRRQSADHARHPRYRGNQPQPERQAVPQPLVAERRPADTGHAHLADQVPDQRAAGPRRRHHGLGRSGADGARAGRRGGEVRARVRGSLERQPQLHPVLHRDPAEPGHRGRPVPGHRHPVHRAGQRRQGAHRDGGADGHHGQAHAGPVRGGQGPADTGQPAVRPAELHPVRSGVRAGDGGAAGGGGQGGLDSWADPRLLIVLATSPRVAPGLLSWPAWRALRSADAVLLPAGHPQRPALAEAGIRYQVADGPGASPADAVVVWLPEPGAEPPVPPGAELLHGSADLPGAHLMDLVATMDRLRVECPWDARQTHASLVPHLLEEPYEALEAFESGDEQAFCEELGDVLLQVVFHARIAAERDDDSAFTIDDVADGIVAKLVRRHPHVFADVTVSGADEVRRNWDEIKREEKKSKAERHGRDVSGQAAPSALDGVPFGQPALALAAQLQRRAARAGVPGELARQAEAGSGEPGCSEPGCSEPGCSIGGELFRLVAAARAADRDPEMELRAAARRYLDLVRRWERGSTNS